MHVSLCCCLHHGSNIICTQVRHVEGIFKNKYKQLLKNWFLSKSFFVIQYPCKDTKIGWLTTFYRFITSLSWSFTQILMLNWHSILLWIICYILFYLHNYFIGNPSKLKALIYEKSTRSIISLSLVYHDKLICRPHLWPPNWPLSSILLITRGGMTGCESFCVRSIGMQLNWVNLGHKNTSVQAYEGLICNISVASFLVQWASALL